MTAKGITEKDLEETLENLSSSSFKSFKRKLNKCDLPKGHERIPWNILEDADAPGVVCNIIKHHTTDYGPDIVIKVLKDINERQASLDLEIKGKKNSKRTRSGETPGSQKKAKNLNLPSTTLKCKHHKEQWQTETNSEDKDHLNDRTVGKSQTSNSGSNVEVGSLDAPGITDHTSQAHAEETNLNSTPEIIIVPVWKETCDSVGPSANSTNMFKEESSYSPVDDGVSTEQKNQPRESKRKSEHVLQNTSNKPLTGHTNKANLTRIRTRGKPLQDLKLPALKKGKRELIEKHSKHQPHLFTKLLFQHFVQYETYVTWHQNTNFDGYGGKNAIPKNLHLAIETEVRQKFPLVIDVDRKIKNTINQLLATLITTGWSDLNIRRPIQE